MGLWEGTKVALGLQSVNHYTVPQCRLSLRSSVARWQWLPVVTDRHSQREHGCVVDAPVSLTVPPD